MRRIRQALARISPSNWFGARSNGVRVGRGTSRLIRQGNEAREAQNWVRAAGAYRSALSIEPHLQHVWVQLGHMEKEAGNIVAATQAYRQAATLAPEDAEPLRQLGYMAKAWQDPAIATQYFIDAINRAPNSLDLLSELARLLSSRDLLDPGVRRKLSGALGPEPFGEPAVCGTSDARAVVCDVTDLLAFFGRRRLPTGIQRLQIEIALACLDQDFQPRVLFAQYSGGRRTWISIPSDIFHHVCLLSKQSDDVDDPVWQQALKRLYTALAFGRAIDLAGTTMILNIGTSWSDKNYLLDVRNVRDAYQTRYICTVFDVIPLVNPAWFIISLVKDYTYSFQSLIHSADGIVAISEATRIDLLKKSEEHGAPFTEDAIAVVPLNGDFRQVTAPVERLRQWGLEEKGFVLLVSTLEPRKNHVGAFEAWLILAKERGEQRLPKLVCVGGRGWLNGRIHEMLRTNQVLKRNVVILHGVADDLLATLYAHCLFAIYPSFYEGWGLPVSEALSYGKVPAISKTSSLPEAGGSYARYFNPMEPQEIASVIRALLDDNTRTEAEAAIHRSYRARSWSEIASELITKANALPFRDDERLPILRSEGCWTLSRCANGAGHDQHGMQRNGEALRKGQSWLFPDENGCRIEGDDAELHFRWKGGHVAAAQVVLACVGETGSVDIEVQGQTFRFVLTAAHACTASVPLPAEDTVVQIRFKSLTGPIVVREMHILDFGDATHRAGAR